MKRFVIAVLLVSVLSLSLFGVVAAAERGYSSGTATIPDTGKKITGMLTVEDPGRAKAVTSINGGYADVVLTAKVDVKPRNGGESLIGGEQVVMSLGGASMVEAGYYYFSASPVTGFSTHHASVASEPPVISLWAYWPDR